MQSNVSQKSGVQTDFNVPGLTFEQQNGLKRVQVKTSQATATIYMQGAHLTAWQPTGFDPAIMLSSKSVFEPGKPIRGGIPIVFPWFATDSKKDRVDGHPGPSHGFARVQDWILVKATNREGVMHLSFTQGPTAISRSMGFDDFELQLDFGIGRTLTLTMTVKNMGQKPLIFEQAFHTYYKISDIHEVSVSGLETTSYLDKTDGFKAKAAAGQPIHFTKNEDRIYNNTTASCSISDPATQRRITVAKSGSNSTVVWNAFAEMADLGPWDWHDYVAVETANVGVDAVTLAPWTSAEMGLHVKLEQT